MKPKTRIQKRVYELSQQLKPITEAKIQWGFDNCLEKYAVSLKKGLTCLECLHTWKDKQPPLLTILDGCTCPNCHSELKIKNTKKRVFKDIEYYGIITTCKEFQVIRYFILESSFKVGRKPYYSCNEVVQHWIDPKGSHVVMSISKQAFGLCYDRWIFNSDMEIRQNIDHIAYNINPYKIHPSRKYIKEVSRNGFKGFFYGLKPPVLFKLLLSNKRAETLIKAKQYNLLSYCKYEPLKIEKYWNQIKICIRNKYSILNASNWMDYIQLLEMFGKDIHNSKFICPTCLNREHDRYVEKKRKLKAKIDLEKRLKELEEAEIIYRNNKERFFDLLFSDGNIIIRPLTSVKEFHEEGTTLKHCVFENKYYEKENSLVLTSFIGNEKLETIEVSLEGDISVRQCYGKFNKPTKYHKQILEIVNNNRIEIQKRLAA